MKCLPLALAGLLLLAAGCTSTREIETSSPRTPPVASPGDESTSRDMRFTVIHEPGETSLPDEIEQLRFRIAEIELRSTEGGWIRLASDMQRIELGGAGRGTRRTVLDTRLTSAEYDSVGISFDEIFVRFDENAGAPLTLAKGEPLRFALNVDARLNPHTTLIVRLEAGASLRQTPDCRWFFVPVVRADLQP